MTQTLGDIKFELRDGLGELTLEHEPDNALTSMTAKELTRFLEHGIHEQGVRALLFTSTGRRFCVGADMREAGSPPKTAMDHRFAYRPFSRLFEVLWQLELPVVTAVNGSVAGIGWLLALLGDFVYADENARWTHVFARRGLVPHGGDPYYLTRLIPFRRLMEISLLSDPIASAKLAEWNVITGAVPADELLPTARAVAERLAQGPTRSLGVAKQVYRRSVDASFEAAAADERSAVALVSTTSDRNEGIASFSEGREPRYTGR